MAHIVDIGKRVELVSMDPHFHDISLALYARPLADGGLAFRVHTYNGRDGAAARTARVAAAMATLGGMAGADDDRLRFPCVGEHPMAVRRVFLEACKLAPDAPPVTRPLFILDKKSGRTITVTSAGGGRYSVSADGDEDGRARRIGAIAGGLAKLGEMTAEGDDGIAFTCGHAHDALVGLLLVRAPNVRLAIREQSDQAGRGVLAAPSAQQT